jgi:hypothetical protein
MNEQEFKKALAETEHFKNYATFKQTITMKRHNIIFLYDKFKQAQRLGIEYIKQNPNIYANDVILIDEVLKNTSQ